RVEAPPVDLEALGSDLEPAPPHEDQGPDDRCEEHQPEPEDGEDSPAAPHPPPEEFRPHQESRQDERRDEPPVLVGAPDPHPLRHRRLPPRGQVLARSYNTPMAASIELPAEERVR